MKQIAKHLVAAALGIALCFSISACSSKDVAYPINLDGTEIIVGETTVSALYDAGYTIMALDTETHTGASMIEASYLLEADSYYSALYTQKGDVKIATLTIVTDSKAVPMSEAVIASVKVNSELDHPMDKATFAGIPLLDLTAEKVLETIPGSKLYEDGTFAYLSGANHTFTIDYKDGVPICVEMKRKYDVERQAS